MKHLALPLLLFLPACAFTEAGRAEERYEMIERGGEATKDQLCQAAIEVRDAHLRAGHEWDYQLWSVKASNDCYRPG